MMDITRLNQHLDVLVQNLESVKRVIHTAPKMTSVYEHSVSLMTDIEIWVNAYVANQEQWQPLNNVYTGKASWTQFLMHRLEMPEVLPHVQEAKVEVGIIDFFTPLLPKYFRLPLEDEFLKKAEQYRADNKAQQEKFYSRQLKNIEACLSYGELRLKQLEILLGKVDSVLGSLSTDAQVAPFKEAWTKYYQMLCELTDVFIDEVEQLQAYKTTLQTQKNSLIAEIATNKNVLPENKPFWDALTYVEDLHANEELNFLYKTVAKKEQENGRASAPQLKAVLSSPFLKTPERPPSVTSFASGSVSLNNLTHERLYMHLEERVPHYKKQVKALLRLCGEKLISLERQPFQNDFLVKSFEKWKKYFVNLNSTLKELKKQEKTKAEEVEQTILNLQREAQAKINGKKLIKANLSAIVHLQCQDDDNSKEYWDLCQGRYALAFEQVVRSVFNNFGLDYPSPQKGYHNFLEPIFRSKVMNKIPSMVYLGNLV